LGWATGLRAHSWFHTALACGFILRVFGGPTFVLAEMKIATGGRRLWTRTIGSTLVGQGLDSLVFILIAFWGVFPTESLPLTIVTQWLIKTTYEVLVAPLTYVLSASNAMVNFLKRREGLDVFDQGISFNPLTLKD
jgi:hypothetical protein